MEQWEYVMEEAEQALWLLKQRAINMDFGFCNLSIIPCRKDPSDKSEMVSQLLFGEYFEVTEEYKSWVHIISGIDKYSGWIDRKQYKPVAKETYNGFKKHSSYYTSDLVGIMTDVMSNTSFPIMLGSVLPFFKNKEIKFENHHYTYEGNVIHPAGKPKRSKIVEDAFMFLRAPYLWGGRTPLGIDCSGFTQMVYRLNGISIPRDAKLQAELGVTLDFPEEAQPGDLAFFDNEQGIITHTGIVLDNGQIIHSSGQVHIDKLDHLGIYNDVQGKYTHELRVLKRMI
jgi:cell wall-associated NlpC family hydrolase